MIKVFAFSSSFPLRSYLDLLYIFCGSFKISNNSSKMSEFIYYQSVSVQKLGETGLSSSYR